MEFKYKIIAFFSASCTILFGQFDIPLQTLIILMSVDYITGIIVAGFFNNSKKSEDGSLSSNVGFRGIIKKGMMLAIVLVAYRLDLLASTNIVRNTVIAAFIANESISINENAVLMGIDIPKYFTDILKGLKK